MAANLRQVETAFCSSEKLKIFVNTSAGLQRFSALLTPSNLAALLMLSLCRVDVIWCSCECGVSYVSMQDEC